MVDDMSELQSIMKRGNLNPNYGKRTDYATKAKISQTLQKNWRQMRGSSHDEADSKSHAGDNEKTATNEIISKVLREELEQFL